MQCWLRGINVVCFIVISISLWDIPEDNVGYLSSTSILICCQVLSCYKQSYYRWQIPQSRYVLGILIQQAGRNVFWGMIWGGISSPCVGLIPAASQLMCRSTKLQKLSGQMFGSQSRLAKLTVLGLKLWLWQAHFFIYIHLLFIYFCRSNTNSDQVGYSH